MEEKYLSWEQTMWDRLRTPVAREMMSQEFDNNIACKSLERAMFNSGMSETTGAVFLEKFWKEFKKQRDIFNA